MSTKLSHDEYMECTYSCKACAVCKGLDGHPGYDPKDENLTLDELDQTQKDKIYVPETPDSGWFGSAYWTGWEILIVVGWTVLMAGLLFENGYGLGLFAQWCWFGLGAGNVQCEKKYGIRPYDGLGSPGYIYRQQYQPHSTFI